MATMYVADCSKIPSEMGCDIKITGSDRDAVEDLAFHHAVSLIHHHNPDEEGLKEGISETIEVFTV